MKFFKKRPFNFNKTEIEINYITRDTKGNENDSLDISITITNKMASIVKEVINSAIKSGKKIDLPNIKKLFE